MHPKLATAVLLATALLAGAATSGAADLPGPRPATGFVADPSDRAVDFRLDVSIWIVATRDRRTGLYGAYQQHSLWHIDDSDAPFRVENDFRPEIGAALGPDVGGRLLGAWPEWLGLSGAFVHESNGLEGEFSRGWNRLLATLHLRPASGRLSASASAWTSFRVEERNADITDHCGVGELRLAAGLPGWLAGSTLQLRSAFSPDAPGPTVFSNFEATLYLRPRFLPDWLARGDAGAAVDFVVRWFTGTGEFLYDYDTVTRRLGIGLALRPQSPGEPSPFTSR